MKISTGHPVSNDEVVHDFTCVRFLTDEGRPIFEVRVGEDGRSIDVRGIDCCRVDGVMYSEALEISPRYSNGVEIRTKKYGEA